MYSYECEVMCVSQRILWTQEEAIVLLDALIKVLNGHLTRSDAEMLVSKMLRRLAMYCGVEIEDTFRNLTGIHLQMLTMEYIYTDGKSGLKKATMPKLFQDVVDLYNNNKDLFYERLRGISSMENGYNVFEWNIPVSLSYTRPVKCTYCNDLLEDVSSWKDVYCGIVSRLYTDYPDQIASLINTNITTGVRLDLADPMRVLDMISPFKISDFIFLETNYSATDIAVKLKKFLDVCNVDYQNVVIYYDRKMDAEKLERVTSAVESYSVLEKRFIDWMVSSGNAQRTAQSYTSSIRSAERYASKHSFTYSTILTENLQLCEKAVDALLQDAKFKEYDIQQHRRFSAAMKKYVSFLQQTEGHYEATNDRIGILSDSKSSSGQTKEVSEGEQLSITENVKIKYESILEQYFFDDGYQLGRAIVRARFKRYYFETYGIEMSEPDEMIDKIIFAIGDVRDGRVFPKRSKDQHDLIDQIVSEMTELFRSGVTAIYAEAIYEKYRQKLIDDLHIYNSEVLSELLLSKTVRVFQRHRKSYFSPIGVAGDVEGDLKRIVSSFHVPTSREEIHKEAWFIPYDKMKYMLSLYKAFINMNEGRYLYAPNLPVSAEELKEIIRLISAELECRTYITDVELQAMIEKNLPGFVINTEGLYEKGVRDCLGYLLRDHFSFNGPIITKSGTELRMADVFKEFAKFHEELSLSELEIFAAEMNIPIYWDNVLSEMILISEDLMILNDFISFDIDAIDSLLESMCPGDYIPLQEIQLFLSFPNIGYMWNSYLLESYLYQVSKKFHLLHVSFGKKGAYGAMVKNTAPYQGYRELAIEVLSESNAVNSKEAALQYLVNHGYQARRRLDDIDGILKAAKLLKEQKEKQ